MAELIKTTPGGLLAPSVHLANATGPQVRGGFVDKMMEIWDLGSRRRKYGRSSAMLVSGGWVESTGSCRGAAFLSITCKPSTSAKEALQAWAIACLACARGPRGEPHILERQAFGDSHPDAIAMGGEVPKAIRTEEGGQGRHWLSPHTAKLETGLARRGRTLISGVFVARAGGVVVWW